MNIKKTDVDTSTGQVISLSWFLATAMADIDIFLLKKEDQITDKNKIYTTDEIREQLNQTMLKMLEIAYHFNINKDASLLDPFTNLKNMELSKKEKEEIISHFLRNLKESTKD